MSQLGTRGAGPPLKTSWWAFPWASSSLQTFPGENQAAQGSALGNQRGILERMQVAGSLSHLSTWTTLEPLIIVEKHQRGEWAHSKSLQHYKATFSGLAARQHPPFSL